VQSSASLHYITEASRPAESQAACNAADTFAEISRTLPPPFNTPQPAPGYYAEVVDVFASAFIVLDSYSLRVTVGQHIPALYEAILENSALISIPKLLISDQETTNVVADCMLSFLVYQFDDIAGWDPNCDEDSDSTGTTTSASTADRSSGSVGATPPSSGRAENRCVSMSIC